MRFLPRLILTSGTGLAVACVSADTRRPTDSTVAGVDSVRTPLETFPDAGPGPSPWDAARRRGIDFRAIGQEPGWVLEIDREKGIHLLADYGSRVVDTPVPTPTRDTSGILTYDARTEAHRLTIVMREVVCHDVMSGEEMTHTVTVTLDGTEYRGCGRDLTTGGSRPSGR